MVSTCFQYLDPPLFLSIPSEIYNRLRAPEFLPSPQSSEGSCPFAFLSLFDPLKFRTSFSLSFACCQLANDPSTLGRTMRAFSVLAVLSCLAMIGAVPLL
jgi:hypothetical protein